MASVFSSPRGGRVIAIGASAGGVEALTSLIAKLPGGLGAPVLVTLHIPADQPSQLPRILRQAGALPACHPDEGDPLLPGRIYVAPPGCHLLLRGDRVHLSSGPREHGFRPAVDPMFRSAVESFGNRTIGVVLSGIRDDGTLGLAVIRAVGGVSIVQDPDTALFAEMPRNAVSAGVVDHVLPVDQMAELLVRLVEEPADGGGRLGDEARMEARMTDIESQELTGIERIPGVSSDFTCPSCNGVLRRIDDGVQPLHFRCQVGHGWAIESLRAEQRERIEHLFWKGLRALVEHVKLLRELAEDDRHPRADAELLLAQADEAAVQVDALRDVLATAGRVGSARPGRDGGAKPRR